MDAITGRKTLVVAKLEVSSVRKTIKHTDAITSIINPNEPSGSRLPPNQTDKPLYDTALARLKPVSYTHLRAHETR